MFSTSSGNRLLRLGVEKLLLRRGIENFGRTVRVVPRNTPYDAWLDRAKSEIPLFEGLVIDDVRTVPLLPWPQMGDEVNGLYLRFSDYQMTDGRVLEIPAGGASGSRRRLFETGICFLGGPGHTSIQQEGREPQRVEWGYASLLSIPLNVRFQHFNDGDEPVRLLEVTSFPFVLNATNNERFVLDNPFAFTDRYDARESYPGRPEHVEKHRTVTNFVPDAVALELARDRLRGHDAMTMRLVMAGNTMISLHVAEMAGMSHKKAHRHNSDAFVLVLSGEGYSVSWPDGGYERRERVDWHEGTLFVPPVFWYHQHFNPGEDPARYLAINPADLVKDLGLRLSDQQEADHPEIRAEWADEIAGGR